MTAIAEPTFEAAAHSEPWRDPEALVRDLYQEHYPVVAGYAGRMLADRQAGEDVAQETLLRAWRNASVLVPESGTVRGWLLRVAHNIAVDKIRARNARPAEVAESAASVACAAAAVDHAEQVVNTAYVRAALTELSPDHRAVVCEIYFNHRTVAETAAALDIPVGTVKSRVYYALRTLRFWMAEHSVG